MIALMGIAGIIACLFVTIVGTHYCKLDWVANIGIAGIAISFIVMLYGTYQNTSDDIARCNKRCGDHRRIACGRLDGPYRPDGEGPEFSVCAKDGSSVLVIAPK